MARDISDALQKLRKVLGDRAVCTDQDILRPWVTDWRGAVTGRAAAMISPADTAGVSAAVHIAAQARLSVQVQGGNSGMCAGATPDASGEQLLLSLRAMNRMRHVDAESRLMTADAGVILQTAHEAAEAVDCRFPLTLGGKGSATLGGLVSTNAGGTQVLRHGTMRALTAGLEVVLADGTILDQLTPLAKDNRGPDLKQMFIGGEGAFGIVTGVTLRLAKAIKQRTVAWLAVQSPDIALQLLRLLTDELGNALEGFELIPETAVAAVLAHEPAQRRPLGNTPWHVLIEVVAENQTVELLDRVTNALGKASTAEVLTDAVIASNETQATAFWSMRDGISAAERAKGPALQHDVSVPVQLMPQFIEQIDRVIPAQFSGATTLSFGHLGDGNVHCHVRPPQAADADNWIAAYGEQASRAVYDLAISLGGSISAEHGIGRSKRQLLLETADPARISLLRGMKAAFDPTGLFNPGILIP